MGLYRAGLGFNCKSGSIYTADSNGYCYPTTLEDLKDLLTMGGAHIVQNWVGPQGVTGATGP